MFYYLGFKIPVIKYLVAVIFLVDFYLTWSHNRSILRGDPATNISAGFALISGLIGKIIAFILHFLNLFLEKYFGRSYKFGQFKRKRAFREPGQVT